MAGQLLTRACLVCRRWRDAVHSEPALWRAFTLRADLVMADQPFQRQAAWLAASFNLLRRVGQHVESFTAVACGKMEERGAGAAGGWRLPQFLRLLHPSRLTALTLEYRHLPTVGELGAAAAEAVASFSQLSALHLGSAEQLPACTGAVLRQLSGLQRLRLRQNLGSEPVPGWLASVGQLESLTFLALTLGKGAPFPSARLSNLQHLDLYGGTLAPPALGAFPLLRSYMVDNVVVRDLLSRGIPGCWAAAIDMLPCYPPCCSLQALQQPAMLTIRRLPCIMTRLSH